MLKTDREATDAIIIAEGERLIDKVTNASNKGLPKIHLSHMETILANFMVKHRILVEREKFGFVFLFIPSMATRISSSGMN